MRIKRINIRNFRGYESYETKFHPNTTVIIGNNMDGKTSLLQAVEVGLGAYFQAMKCLPAMALYRKNFVKSDRFLKYDDVLRDYVANDESTRIDVVADFWGTNRSGDVVELNSNEIHWYREMSKSGNTIFNRACAQEIMDAVEQMETARFNEHKASIFPLYLAFATNRIDKQFRSTKKVNERAQKVVKAYRAALLDNVDFAGAMSWLDHYDKSLKDGKEFEGTREAFYEALTLAIPALSEVDYDNKELEAVVTVTRKQPLRHHYSYMSDGLKAIINVVAEIAYKSILLNGFMGREAVRMTPGVVMIDEVDMYLHPRWQRHILNDLHRAFPYIQFIVTTHSPFIVQSVGEDQLINLDVFEDMVQGGTPSNESLEDIAACRMGMAQEIRSANYTRMLEKAEEFFEKMDAGENVDELEEELTQMESEFSENAAYVAFIRSRYRAKLMMEGK